MAKRRRRKMAAPEGEGAASVLNIEKSNTSDRERATGRRGESKTNTTRDNTEDDTESTEFGDCR